MGGEIMWMMAAGLAASALGNYLNSRNQAHSDGKAYQRAINSINNYTNQGIGYLNPYHQFGINAGNSLQNELNQFSNPEEFYNNFAKNYQMSAGAQNKLNTGLDAVRNAMASRGLAGSGSEAKALTNYTQGVINEDMQNQYNDVLNAGRLGAGIGSTLYGGGVQAALRGAGLYGQAGEDTAELQEAEAAARAQAEQNGMGGLMGGLGAGLGIASHFWK